MTGGGGAILKCSAPPAESCPTYQDAPLPAESTLLSATLTVGTHTRVARITAVLAGYNSVAGVEVGSLGSTQFSYRGTSYSIGILEIHQLTTLGMVIDDTLRIDIEPAFPTAFHSEVALEIDGQRFPLSEAEVTGIRLDWPNHGLTWADGNSVQVKITGPHSSPNAYGFRTIWTALMTAEQHPTVLTRFGYSNESYGKLTNNIIVNGRTDRGVVDDQFRYPWSGFEIIRLNNPSVFTDLVFDSDSYPSTQEVAGWTLVLDGKELPFAGATNDALTPHLWSFSYAPGWTAGQQVVVSIRTEDVQNRYGQVALKARRSTRTDGDNNILYGKSHYTYARGTSRFGPGGSWDLQNLRVTTDKTGDTDPVWITATFRAPNESVAWTGYWVGQFDDFHTLFLRWIYHDGGVGRGEATYTLPLKTAATEGGIRRSRSGREVTFTWVRTYKEEVSSKSV